MEKIDQSLLYDGQPEESPLVSSVLRRFFGKMPSLDCGKYICRYLDDQPGGLRFLRRRSHRVVGVDVDVAEHHRTGRLHITTTVIIAHFYENKNEKKTGTLKSM